MIGSSASLPSRPLAQAPKALASTLGLPLAGVLLASVPVFVQAPLVRLAPMLAAALTLTLVAAAVVLERHGRGLWRDIGSTLAGFSGSWLAGSLFWGWCRLHPLWHLPIEAFALPLALAGLNTRWRLGAAFYLASLLGTAATDTAIAASGLMPLWPQVLSTPMPAAASLLRLAGELVLTPVNLTLVLAMAALLLQLSALLWGRGPTGRLAAATLAATVAVDGLFLASALLAPSLSGAI